MPVCVVTKSDEYSELINILADITLDAYALYQDALERTDPSEQTLKRIIENTVIIQQHQLYIGMEKGTGWT